MIVHQDVTVAEREEGHSQENVSFREKRIAISQRPNREGCTGLYDLLQRVWKSEDCSHKGLRLLYSTKRDW